MGLAIKAEACRSKNVRLAPVEYILFSSNPAQTYGNSYLPRRRKTSGHPIRYWYVIMVD
jgi:hypothetical protein